MKAIELTWEGGENSFALPIAQMRALQAKCDAGPAFIFARLTSGTWLVDDVLQTIRFGLEGGGTDKDTAYQTMTRYCEPDHLGKHVIIAAQILQFAIWGEGEGDDVGEPHAEAEKS